MTKAKAIATASARYNLGLPRTVNVPTAPLDIIHPIHRTPMRYELLGEETVRGTRTTCTDRRSPKSHARRSSASRPAEPGQQRAI